MKLFLTAAALIGLAAPTFGQSKDIVETAVSAGSFNTLAAALKAADLVETLQGDGPFTVFAPTDEAFAKIPKDQLQALLQPENRDQLTAILTYHVVAGRVMAKDALNAEQAATVQGKEVSFALREGSLRVNDSRVIANDIACSNGVIHVIDTVLLPPQPKGKKVIGIYSKSPSRDTRRLLDLEKDEGFLVTSLMPRRGAQDAGLLSHDVIIAVNGKPATQANLDAAKESAGNGGTVKLTFARTVPVKVSIQKEH